MQVKEKGPTLKQRANRVQNLGVIMIMVVFIAVVVIVSGSKFFNTTNLLNLLRSISVTGIMACAVTLVMVTGNIDLSIGWMIGLTACLTGIYSNNLPMAIGLALTVGAACGAINGFLVGVLKLNAFITTLATSYVFNGITMLYTEGKLLTTKDASPILKNIGQGSLLGIPIPIWIFAVIAVIFWFLLKKTTFGNKIYAVGSNPISSRFSGVSSAKVTMAVYVLAGLAVGLAGIVFFSKTMSVQQYSGVGLEFEVLTAIVLGGTSVAGGRGNVLGTVLGVVFVGILGNGFTLMGLGSNAQYIAQGLILLVAMRADVMNTGGHRA